MSDPVRTIRIKDGMPSVDQARRRLLAELQAARCDGVQAVKLIHGYGSTGAGGALRDALRSSLRKRRKEGAIRAFVPGEKWDVFDATAAAVLEACPALARDADLNRYNEGVTIVLL